MTEASKLTLQNIRGYRMKWFDYVSSTVICLVFTMGVVLFFADMADHLINGGRHGEVRIFMFSVGTYACAGVIRTHLIALVNGYRPQVIIPSAVKPPSALQELLSSSKSPS